MTSNIHDAATSINDATDNVKNGWTVEFAEKYQPDLALKDTADDFGRPAHTWTWKKAEIGTYVDFDKMVAEYTTKVTGEDLYNLLGKTAIEDNTLFVYVDGEDENLGDAAFGKADMVKKNDETIGRTGNGVLTQVFLDTQDDEITVAIINTYLAKAAEDYDEKNDDVDLDVYYVDNNGTSRKPVYMKTADEDKPQKQTISVDGEDFAIEEVAENDLFLVTIAQVVTLANILQFSAIFGGNRDENGNSNPIAALVLAILAPIAASLIQMAISRSREYLADDTGAALCGQPLALAGALHRLGQASGQIPMHQGNPSTEQMFIVTPLFGNGGMARLFSTHPPLEERIARLQAMARHG